MTEYIDIFQLTKEINLVKSLPILRKMIKFIEYHKHLIRVEINFNKSSKLT